MCTAQKRGQRLIPEPNSHHRKKDTTPEQHDLWANPIKAPRYQSYSGTLKTFIYLSVL